jgi:hypothetical protein
MGIQAVKRWLPALLLALAACGQPGREQPPVAASDAAGAEDPATPKPCRPQLEKLPPSGEGMWPWTELGDLDERLLRRRGLEIPLARIWTPGKGGLARAAVGLRGCSASFVSRDGLLLTNHHCAFKAVQRNSTDERNILRDGFLAGSRAEELDGHGLRVLVFAGHTDVTEQVLGRLPAGISDLERMEQIELAEKRIVSECEAKPNTRCEVSRNNDGLSFVLLERTELRDVRLVAAPPRGLGEFGGEVDNWRWPRHTMDFALLRAYVAPDGTPAAFATHNVPYRPDQHFSVGPEGISPGDLVMVVGTPYRTARYRTAASVREDAGWYYPLREELFTAWIELLERTCRELPEACLPTSSQLKSLNNARTNAEGMLIGLERNRVLERKRELEARWREWIAADPERKTRWGHALDELERFVEKDRAGRDRDFVIRYLLWGNKLTWFARTITKWAAEQVEPDEQREPGYQARDRENLASDLAQAQRSLHLEADRRNLAFLLGRLGALPANERIQAFDRALGGDWSAASIERFTEKLYAGSHLGQVAVRKELFGEDIGALEQSRDAAIRLGMDLMPELDAYEERRKARDGAWSRLRPPYIESLVQMLGARFYPDANASPRISFATVTGYRPKDGIWHTPLTTLSGLAAKATGQEPFHAPENALARIAARDFGRFADTALEDVPVCFLSNADTTGGNSGSPALDGKGRLVGLNFDRVYENIAGDYGYNPELSRNIMVEVRSILWYLDRVLEANHLLEEMGVKDR